MADENQLENEVLDFDDDMLPELPEDSPFVEGKSKKTWLIIAIGVIAVVLVVAVILRLTKSRDEVGLIEIPIEIVETAQDSAPGIDFVEGANKMVAIEKDTKPAGMPERVVEKRPDVVFDPDKPVVKRPSPRPVATTSSKPVVARPAVKTVQPKPGNWTVQIGSYNSRAAAEAGQRQMQSAYKNLFTGFDFAVLAAVLPNGQTVYRLRVVGFENNADANNFCNNAQNERIDCYVTK